MSPPCVCSHYERCSLAALSLDELRLLIANITRKEDLYNVLIPNLNYSLQEARFAHQLQESCLSIVMNDDQAVQILIQMHNSASEMSQIECLLDASNQQFASLERYKERVELHVQLVLDAEAAEAEAVEAEAYLRSLARLLK